MLGPLFITYYRSLFFLLSLSLPRSHFLSLSSLSFSLYLFRSFSLVNVSLFLSSLSLFFSLSHLPPSLYLDSISFSSPPYHYFSSLSFAPISPFLSVSVFPPLSPSSIPLCLLLFHYPPLSLFTLFSLYIYFSISFICIVNYHLKLWYYRKNYTENNGTLIYQYITKNYETFI